MVTVLVRPASRYALEIQIWRQYILFHAKTTYGFQDS